MTKTNDITIGATVARKSKGASTGRTGQVIELHEGQARVHWTKKSNGEPMSQRNWINEGELMVVSKPVITIDELAYIAWIGEKKAQRQEWIAKGERGELKDDDNPAFMFSTTNTALLTKIVNGEVTPLFMASMELAQRGLDKQGNWVGFAEAEKIHFPTK